MAHGQLIDQPAHGSIWIDKPPKHTGAPRSSKHPIPAAEAERQLAELPARYRDLLDLAAPVCDRPVDDIWRGLLDLNLCNLEEINDRLLVSLGRRASPLRALKKEVGL
jgi:hypothetical protein